MKRIFKTIPAALALIALTSCSNDDLFGSRSPEAAGLKTLDVTVEQLNDGTLSNAMNANRRAANVGEGNTLIWQNEDVITVYDDKLFLYDPYKFNGTSFVIADDKHIVETPQFAVFPNTYFTKGSTNYDRDEDKVFVTANITRTMNYGKAYSAGTTEGSSYVDYDGKAAYVSLLPMWGTAKDEGSKVAVSLKYMTAILKVTLTNAMGNANYLHVRAYQDIAHTKPAQLNGNFTADLSSSGRTPLASTMLEPTMTTGMTDGTENVLDIDIRNINKATSVIYVPIPATHYGLVQVWADNTAAGGGYAALTAANKVYEFIDKTFEVKFYGSLTKKEFDVDGTTVAKLNALLKANASESGDELVLDCAKNGATVATATTDDVISIPAMAAANVELKLADITTAAATIAGEDFTGKLILNLTAANATTALTINLPNADVVLKGSNTGARTITIENAKTVTFGDGTAPVAPATETTNYNAATIALNAEVQGEVKVAKYAKVNALALADNHRSAALTVEGEAGALTVNASANVTATTVTVSGKAGAITTPNDASTITVSGEAGAITMTGTGKATVSGIATSISNKAGGVEISGAPYINMTDSKYAKIDGNVTTDGDVTVNLSNEGAAIGGILTMNKAAALNLTQGYVKALTLNLAAAKDEVSLTLGDQKYVALGTVTLTQGKLKLVNSKNVWNGKDVAASLSTSTKDAKGTALTAANINTIKTDWAGYGDATAIYTATTFANLAGSGAITLANSIDLNNQDWTPVDLAGNFNGAGHTISNLTIPAKADKNTTAANAGIGLFTTVANHTVKDLTIDGVNITANPYKVGAATTKTEVTNIGALAGLSTGATIQLVTVKNINIEATGGSHTIGGVIGSTNTAKTTFAGVQVSGTNTIKGYHTVGGLVGNAGADVDVTKLAKNALGTTPAADVKSFANLTFQANYDAATEASPKLGNDTKYLQSGSMIGTFATGVVLAITDVDAIMNSNFTRNLTVYTGTMSSIEAGAGDELHYYEYKWSKQNLIGFAGKTAIAAGKYPQINGKYYQIYLTTATATASGLDGSAEAKAFPLYYIVK